MNQYQNYLGSIKTEESEEYSVFLRFCKLLTLLSNIVSLEGKVTYPQYFTDSE